MGIADWRARGKRSRIYLTTETESFYKGALLWIVTSKLTSVTADWRARGKSEQDIQGVEKLFVVITVAEPLLFWAAPAPEVRGPGADIGQIGSAPAQYTWGPSICFCPGVSLWQSACTTLSADARHVTVCLSVSPSPSLSFLPFFFLLFPFFLFSKKQWLLGVELEQDRKKVRYISVHYWRGRR